MDIQNCVMALYTVLLVCLLATAITHGQISEDTIDALLDDLQLDGSADTSNFAPAEYFPENDNVYGESALANQLKRSSFSSSYHRLPRIKQQRIIPFYSYSNDLPRYRSKPRYVGGSGRSRTPYYYTPWNTEQYRPSRVLNRQVYASYRRK